MSEGEADNLPEPGWYRDPTTEGQQRYWDGEAWTQATAPLADTAPPNPPANPEVATPAAPARRSSGTDTGLIIVIAMLTMIGGCGLVLSRMSSTDNRRDAEFGDLPVTTEMPMPTFTTTGPPQTVGPTVTLPASTTSILDDATTTSGPSSAMPLGSYGASMTVPAEMRTGIGSDRSFTVWNVTVDGIYDVTEDLLDINRLMPPPPADQRIVGVPVTMELNHSDRGPIPYLILEESLDVLIRGGDTGGGYAPPVELANDPFGCSSIEPTPEVEALVVGDQVRLLICVQIPTSDLDHGDTTVVVEIDRQRVSFRP